MDTKPCPPHNWGDPDHQGARCLKCGKAPSYIFRIRCWLLGHYWQNIDQVEHVCRYCELSIDHSPF